VNSLNHLQRDFIDSVFQLDGAATQSILSQLNGTTQLSIKEQFKIYQQSIHDGLTNALQQIYPVCTELVGERYFYSMARKYILSNPSRSPDLTDYGESFSKYIKHHPVITTVPYLSDMAKLEWAYHRAFHAPNETGFNIESIYKYSAEQLTKCIFFLPDSHHFISSHFPIDRIWEMHQTANEDSLEIEKHAGYYFVFRKSYEIHIDRLTKHEYLFLKAVKQNIPFIEIYDQLADETIASKLLVHSLQMGWINHFTPENI